MTMKDTNASRMKQLLLRDKIAVVPSAYDGLSARVIESAGFDAIHMTGSGSSACLLGMPDLGFATVSEMATHAKNMVQAVNVPRTRWSAPATGTAGAADPSAS